MYLNKKKEINKKQTTQSKKWVGEKKNEKIKQTFLQRRHADGQKAHKKMLNISYY